MTSTIRDFAAALLALAAGSRKVRDDATVRTFNIGIDAGTSPESFHAVVQPSTLQMVAALGASIEITIYPASFGEER